MPDVFDQISPENETGDIFDQIAPSKLQEPFTFKGAGKAYATGYGGGVGGFPGDVASLIASLGHVGFEEGEIVPAKQPIQKGIPGTHETTQMFGGDARNAAERILTHAGQWGGQGTLWSGLPGTVAGSILGTLYGSFMELTDSPIWATALTLLASVGHPEIASNLWKKSGSKGIAFEEALAKSGLPEEEINKVKNTVADVNAGGKPPPPPGGGTPPPPQQDLGRVLIDDIRNAFQKPHKALEEEILPGVNEISKSPFNIAEEALEEIRPVTKGKELGIEVPITSGTPKSLEGRVTLEPKLGESVSKTAFDNDATAGRQISATVKQIAEHERKPVTEAYKKAREISEGHSDRYPGLIKYNEALIDELEMIEGRNTAENAVYNLTQDIRKLVGTPNGLIEQNAAKLVAKADSMAKLANYELPYIGYKAKIKALVKEVNKAVIQSLEAKGKDAGALIKADQMYSRWADRFLGDEITPFFEKKINDPESMFKKAVSDKGTYRAVKDAFGSRQIPIMDKIDRSLVENTMGKYYQNPKLVGTPEYTQDLKNLNELIGKKKTANVDHRLRNRATEFEKKRRFEKEIERRGKETGGKLKEGGKKPKTELDTLADRIAKHQKTEPEELLGKLNSRSGIRQLRKELPKDTFDRMTKSKMREILREGNVEKNYKGKDLYNVLNKRSNHELFSEIMGEAETDAAMKIAKQFGEDIVTLEKAAKLGASLTGLTFLRKLAHVI